MILLVRFLCLIGLISVCSASNHRKAARGRIGLIPSVSPVVPAVPAATAQAISKKQSKHIHEFFQLFGWLRPGTSIPDTDLPKAVRKIQRAMKEPVTGVLSNTMLDIMNRPRCGTEQPYNDTDSKTVTGIQKRYVIWGAKWQQSTITWKFANYTSDVSPSTQRSTASSAFAKWMTQIPLNIVPAASNAKADIYLRFASFGANDTRYAYTTMVSSGTFFTSGNINITFNDDYNWVDDRLFNYTALHEIGHSLGLSHTTVEEAVMYPYFDGYIRPLHPDDKMGIHGIYGWKNPKWNGIGTNSATNTIITVTSPSGVVAPNDGLYQIRSTGQILRYTSGTWVTVDNYPPDCQITGANGTLYQRHTDGSVFLWTGSGQNWQYIGASSDNVIDITAAADQVYARRKDGWITRWSGSDTTWLSIEQPEAQTSQQIAITDSKTLWNLLSSGDVVRSTWPYDADGWEIVDQNTANIAIATGGEEFYKLQNDGSVVWLNSQENYWEVIESSTSVAISAQGTFLYSRHSDGSVWRYTGTQDIWEQLDSNSNSVSIVGDRQGQVWELDKSGDIYNLVS